MRLERSYATCDRWSTNPVSVYMYRWGRALYRSSGIRPSEERHPHMIKDFISSLKKNIRNKITNRWAEMRHPPTTVERAFELANDIEKQLQVADSFKLDFPTYPSRELNEMSMQKKHVEMSRKLMK